MFLCWSSQVWQSGLDHFILSLHVFGCQEALTRWSGPSLFQLVLHWGQGSMVQMYLLCLWGLGTEQSPLKGVWWVGPVMDTSYEMDISHAVDTSHAYLQPLALPPPNPWITLWPYHCSSCNLWEKPNPIYRTQHVCTWHWWSPSSLPSPLTLFSAHLQSELKGPEKSCTPIQASSRWEISGLESSSSYRGKISI